MMKPESSNNVIHHLPLSTISHGFGSISIGPALADRFPSPFVHVSFYDRLGNSIQRVTWKRYFFTYNIACDCTDACTSALDLPAHHVQTGPMCSRTHDTSRSYKQGEHLFYSPFVSPHQLIVTNWQA